MFNIEIEITKKEFKEDILPLLEKLGESLETDSKVWWNIWDLLHHQGDVFGISYFSVPEIFKLYKEKNWLDANLPALLATIENCRQDEKNPKVPEWLEKEYFETLEKAIIYCANKNSENWDRELLANFLMLTCAVKKSQGLYYLIDLATDEENEKFIIELYENS
jgi:hypothetical protein